MTEEAGRLAFTLHESLQKADTYHHFNEGVWTGDAAELLKTEPISEIERVIAYATTDPFWRDKIFSFQYFADKYPTLRAQAKRKGKLKPTGQASEAAIQAKARSYRNNMARAVEYDATGEPIWIYSEEELDELEREYAQEIRERIA